MRRHPIGVLFAVLATACTTSPIEEPDALRAPNAPVQRISIEENHWLAPTDSWLIERTGSISHSNIHRTGSPPVTERVKQFIISPRDFEEVLSILLPVQQRLATGIPCDGPLPTDAGGVTINWSRIGSSSTIDIYFGCASPIMTSTLESYRKAVELLRSLEAAAP